MAVLKLLPGDIRFSRATWALRQLALHDADDPTTQRWMDRSECLAELETVERELKALGESWDDFYSEIVSDSEARAEYQRDDE